MDSIVPFLPLIIFIGLFVLAFQQLAKRSAASRAYGIGGWLLFLIIGLIALSPLLGFSRMLMEIESVERQYPALIGNATWGAFKTVQWILLSIMAGLSMYTGHMLYTGRNMDAVTRAKILLWVIGPGYAVVAVLFVPVFVFGKFEVTEEIVGSLISSCFMASIWTLYLAKSKRVKRTYGGDTARAGEEVLEGTVIAAHEAVSSRSSSERDGVLENIKALLFGGAGLVFGLFFLAIGIGQVVAGYMGISAHWGTGWAVAAVVVGLMFRFLLPLSIGAFFCATDLWGWHWAVALLFVAPGLLFVVPGFIAAAYGAVFRR